MEIRGTLKTMPLADLLRWLSETRQTGTLVFQVGPVRKRLFFREGELVSAASSDPREFLGQILLRKGWISENQLIRAIEEQLTSHRLLGSILVEKGWISESQLKQALQEKACNTIYSLFLTPEAHFEFLESQLPDYEIVPIGLPIEAIIMEGIYRKDEWERIQKVFPARERTILARVEDATLPPDLRRDWLTQRVFRSINGQRSLAEIALVLYETDFHVFRSALRLYERNLVHIVGEQPSEVEWERVQVPIDMMLEACQERLRKGELDEALRIVDYIETHYPSPPPEFATLQTVIYQKIVERFRNQIPPTAIPRLKISVEEFTRYRLDPMQGFLITRINGIYDVQTLRNLVPVPEERFYILLKRLIDLGIVEFQSSPV